MAEYERLERVYLTEAGLLNAAAARIAEDAAEQGAGVPEVEAIVETGDPASTIVRMAEASRADLIVWGAAAI